MPQTFRHTAYTQTWQPRDSTALPPFTRDFANWSLNTEDVIVLSMDLSMRCHAGIAGDKAITPVGLERYTARAVYDFAKDADLLKWSVPQELRAKFDKCINAQMVGTLIANYEAAAENYNKRVPHFLEIGGLCTGITN